LPREWPRSDAAQAASLARRIAVGPGALLFAWTGYPPPGSDAPGFLVSAINLARGHGFVNQLYPQAALADPSGGRRHIYNAPLFPLVLAGLMPFPTPQGAFLVVAALHGASLLLCVLFFSRLLGAYGAGWTWANAGLASAAPLRARYPLDAHGRPARSA
jgi:hypothetical protein